MLNAFSAVSLRGLKVNSLLLGGTEWGYDRSADLRYFRAKTIDPPVFSFNYRSIHIIRQAVDVCFNADHS